MADGKVKIAILGGGMGAMSAALALTEANPKGEKYDITVHQLGWRLGSMTASDAKQPSLETPVGEAAQRRPLWVRTQKPDHCTAPPATSAPAVASNRAVRPL
jgi:hypothetical protein